MKKPNLYALRHPAVAAHAGHWGERAHLLYFALVFVESHGFYGWAAALCLTLGLLGEIYGGAGVPLD